MLALHEVRIQVTQQNPRPDTSLLIALRFPAAVLAFVIAALAHPPLFGEWLGYDLKGLIVPLIQVIMFGMGATLGVRDFARVARQPKAVLIGMGLQFTVMPLVGVGLARAFGFSNELATGVILVGCASGGVASNVITFLAKGNVPLSVTMTLCSTLASPFATPWLMKLLAGQLMEIRVGEMMLSIINMIVLPVFIGLAGNQILKRGLTSAQLWAIAASATGLAIAVGAAPLGPLALFKAGVILGLAFLALIAVGKQIFQGENGASDAWFYRMLPALSMLGICLVIAVITARSKAELMTAGVALIAVAALHNLLGFTLGYAGARAAKLSVADSRTVAIEVGMQNSGMSAALAMTVLKSPAAALPSAVFGPWMNIAGALLASWWKRQPTQAAPPESSSRKSDRGTDNA